MEYFTDDSKEKPWMKLNCELFKVGNATYTVPVFFNLKRNTPLAIAPNNGTFFLCDAIILNQTNGGLNGNVFTCPAGGDGLYWVSCSGTIEGKAPSSPPQEYLYYSVSFAVNDNNDNTSRISESQELNANQNYDSSFCISQVYELASGDTLKAGVLNNSNYAINLHHTNFSCYRLIFT